MPLFRLDGDKLIIAQETNLELEKHLEDWLENSPLALAQEPFLWIGRQTSATDEGGTIYSDLLGVDSDGNLVIAELKKGRTPRDIIAQLLDYAAWADGLSESQIREIAEAYFETRGEFQGKTFDAAFKDVFDMPETDEIPPLNRAMRLFIAAEEIPERVARVCRFLRTSHGMDISCIAVSTFETESGEVLVSTEKTVGGEGFAAPKAQQQRTSLPSRDPSNKPVKQVVWEGVQELTQGKTDVEFSIKEVTTTILKKNPDFKQGTVNWQMTMNTVNNPSGGYHSSDTDDYYWRVERGKYRLYDPERDKIPTSNG
jgi:hypothetical protein